MRDVNPEGVVQKRPVEKNPSKTSAGACSGSTMSASMSTMFGIDVLQNPFQSSGPIGRKPRVEWTAQSGHGVTGLQPVISRRP